MVEAPRKVAAEAANVHLAVIVVSPVVVITPSSVQVGRDRDPQEVRAAGAAAESTGPRAVSTVTI